MKDAVEPPKANASAPMNSLLPRLAWLPIPAFILIIAVLAVLRIETVWNPPDLIPVLNIVFLTCISFFISILAARSFLAVRSLPVLMLGSGTLALGLGRIGASLYLAGPGTNSMVSVYNTMACVAGLCYLISATGIAISGPGRLRSGWPPLLAAYIAIAILITSLILLVHGHIWPVHFVDGSGQTAFGMAILWITAAAFGLSAIMLIYGNVAGDRSFYRWYGLGLGLIAVGLAGISLQSNLGDPLNWTGRISEYIGTVYMLAAVITSIKARGDWMLPLEKALRESEDRYRAFFENSFDAILITTPEIGVIEANEAACRMFGMTEEELITAGREGLVDMSDPRLGPALEERARTGHFKGELNFRRKDGTIFPVEESNVIYTDKDGRQKSIMIIRDITERKRADEALRESEGNLATAQRIAHLGFWVWDIATNTLQWSDETYRILGLQPGAMAPDYDTFMGFVHPADRETVTTATRVALEGRAEYDVEWRACRKDGTVGYVYSQGVVVRENGRPVRMIGTILDVTGRKKAEEALKSERDFSKAILDHANALVVVFDAEGRIVTFNKYCEESMGYRFDEVKGEKFWELFIDAEQKQNMQAIFARIRDSGLTVKGENYWKARDGRRRLIQWSNTVLLDESGLTRHVIAIGIDVTERNQVEQALRASEAQIRTLVQNLKPGVSLIDETGRFVVVNPSFLRMFGLDPGMEIMNINSQDWGRWEVFDEDGRLLHVDEHPVRKAALTGQSVRNRVVTVRNPGTKELTWMQITAEPLAGPGGRVERIICTYHDITELKQAENALRDSKMQAELYLDLMGHDINNMHQIAIGYLELAMDDPELAGTDRNLIVKPLETLQRSAKLIDNVRKIQMVQKGEIENDAVDLDDVLERVVGEYRDIGGGRIACSNGTGPYRVMANELLYDVFANLVANAIKHSNGNGVDISIAVDSIVQVDALWYSVTVEDSGPGIPDEMKEKVFNRLQRGETKARGMGLGLYLVKSLVDSYHGCVWVEDRVPGDYGKGSKFVVVLPACDS